MAWNEYIQQTNAALSFSHHTNLNTTTWSKTSHPGKLGTLSYSSHSVYLSGSDNYYVDMNINSSTEGATYPVFITTFDDNGLVVSQSSSSDYNSNQVNYTMNNTYYQDGPWTFNEGLPPIPKYGYGCEIMSANNAINTINTNILLVLASASWVTSTGNLFNHLLSEYRSSGDPTIFDDYPLYIVTSYKEEEPVEPDGTLYEIYNTGQRGTWSAGDVVSNVSSPYYRWVKVKLASSGGIDGRLAFYKGGLEDGILKLKPVSVASVTYCEYSTDGGANWTTSQTFPYDYIYDERTNEIGTFIYATRSGLQVPIFEDAATAAAWVNHDPSVDISSALNYEDIANRYPITNPTGAEETGTTMGDGSYLRNYFSQEYVCSQNAIYEISNDFFDTGAQGIWEAIEEGLPMMGSNPIDCVCGLKWFPYDLSDILTGLAAAQNYIYFGGYQYTLPSATVRKVVNHGGYKSLGTFTIQNAFPNPNDFRNFEPWCKLKIYIPTVGIQDLSYNKYRGKTTEVRLYVDIKSGNTLIALLADGILYDFFNGSSGVDIPITLTDKAELAQAQLRNISNLAGVGINMGTAAATKNLGAAVASVANFESTMLDLNNTTADQFNVTKGGSSPMGNGCFLPNYVYLIFEYIKTAETPNLNQLEGRITNRSGSLNSFSGYLQIDSINLRTTADMSENEKNEFVNLLQSGIFI